MRNVYLYIAMTLDGFIADSCGSVSFLNEFQEDSSIFDSYNAFVEKIDSVVMGYNTYSQIVNELSVDVWPYASMSECYVFTSRTIDDKNIITVNEDTYSFISRLKSQDGRGIWICGGSNTINSIIECELIDYYHISIVPKLLGCGVKLFDNVSKRLNLIDVCRYDSGVVELIYSAK